MRSTWRTCGGTLHRLVNPDAPTLALRVNQHVVHPGDRLRVSVSVGTGAVPVAADGYFGIVFPDGQTVVFLTSTTPLAGVASSLAADPRTFAALAPDTVIPAGTAVTIEDVLVYTLGATEQVGTYLIFAALVRDGAFDDGRVDPGDLLALAGETVIVSHETP